MTSTAGSTISAFFIFKIPRNPGGDFHQALFLRIGELVRGEFADSQGADDAATRFRKTRNRQGAGNTGLTGVRPGHSSQIRLQVAKLHRLPALGGRDRLDGVPVLALRAV